MPYSAIAIGHIQLDSPRHHARTVVALIANLGLCATEIELAEMMVEHAITTAWATRPEQLRPLDFCEFHEVAAHFEYAELFSTVLLLGINHRRMPELAHGLTMALISNQQLNR